MQPEFVEMNLETEDFVEREAIASTFVKLFSDKNIEEKIECNFCKYKTTTIVFMITHMKEHLGFTFRGGKTPGNSEKGRVCPDCGENINKEHKTCKAQLEMLIINDDEGAL